MADAVMADNHVSDAEQRLLAPFNSHQRKTRFDILAAYRSFWNNDAFTKGAVRPAFELADVEGLLRDAADMVVRLCHQHKWKLDVLSGASHEFLFSFGTQESTEMSKLMPLSHPTEFVHALVHATLQDSNGYVDGFTKANVDEALSVIEHHHADIRSGLLSITRQRQTALAGLLDELFPVSGEQDLSRADLEDVRRVNDKLKAAIVALKETKEHRERRSQDLEARLAASKQVAAERAAAAAAAAEAAERERVERESAEAEARQKAELTKRGLLTIEKIAHDVETIGTEFAEVAELSTTAVLEAEGGDAERALTSVTKTEKTLLGLAGRLMHELGALDTIEGTEDIRPVRKQQVKEIQQLLEEVDAMQHRLEKVTRELRQASAEQKAQRAVAAQIAAAAAAEAAARAKAEAIAAKQASSQAESDPEEESDQDEARETDSKRARHLSAEEAEEASGSITQPRQSNAEPEWRKLRLKPRFEVDERRAAYVVSAYIPGIRDEDLKIELGDETITVSGTRLPTEKELDAMKRQIAQVRQDQFAQYYFPSSSLDNEDDATLLLRIGSGRFGSFSETFRIPNTVNREGIQASYDAGVLQLTLPRRMVQQPVRAAGFPGAARRSPVAPGPGAYGRPGFYGDRDFFW